MEVTQLKNWFKNAKRDLPWRKTKDPYAIWVSEVMLQQTQASVVSPYFLNWMQRFPTVQCLAEASLDEVIKAWEGLGYYSRARNLHAGAKFIMENYNGIFPSSEEDLTKIKGLGPYTIGAILSFAFHQKKAAVDGNVIRVLCRYFGNEGDISKQSTLQQLRGLAESLLPEEEPWVFAEALIELGATVCQKKARCLVCPLRSQCKSFLSAQVEKIPFNSKKTAIQKLYRSVAVIHCKGKVLVRRGAKGKIMSDLYEFPYFEIEKEQFSPQSFTETIKNHFELTVKVRQILKEVVHGFTRYQATLYPVLFDCTHLKEIQGFEWQCIEGLKQLAFSSGHRRIYHQYSDWLQLV